MSKCAEFTTDDYDPKETWMRLMRCPNCGGWLPEDWPIGKSFKCKKCGSTLETLPSIPDTYKQPDGKIFTEPEDTDYEWGGRLCVVPEDIVKRAAVKK